MLAEKQRGSPRLLCALVCSLVILDGFTVSMLDAQHKAAVGGGEWLTQTGLSRLYRREMTRDCEIVDVMFTKSIIRSKASFTYEEVCGRDGPPIPSPTLHIKLWVTSVRQQATLPCPLFPPRHKCGLMIPRGLIP